MGVFCVFLSSNLTSSLVPYQGHNIEQEQPFIMKRERACCFDFPLQWWIMNVNCYVRSFWTLPWRQYVKGSIANKSKILFLGIEMDLNEKGSLLPSDSKGMGCDWKNVDLHLEPWQLVIGGLRRSFIFRSLSCSFDCGKWQTLCSRFSFCKAQVIKCWGWWQLPLC